MKKIFLFLVPLFLGFLVFSNANVTFAATNTEEIPLTKQQVLDKLDEIAKNYEIGELLNEEDAEFVKKYVPAPQPVGKDEIQTLALRSTFVLGTKSNSGNTLKATVSGTIWSDIGALNNSFGGNLATYIHTGNPTRVVTKIRHIAFGLFGSGGTFVGLVQNETLQSDVTKNFNTDAKIESSHRYAASVAYSTTYAEADIYYGSGSLFTVEADSLEN